MKTVVITGSTRGVGYGMAEEFLKRGHQVMISGRSEAKTAQAVSVLTAKYGSDRVRGQACNMGVYEQVQNLWDSAVTHFGKVDIWLNNAGQSNSRFNFWEIPPEMINSVVSTNLLGVMYGSKVAIKGMLKQGFGQIFNTEGMGSNGTMQSPYYLLYGSTKCAVTFLTKYLIKETAKTPVKVGYLGPGIVVTELLTGTNGDKILAKEEKLVNAIADRVETVAPFLVTKILANQKHGARIDYLNLPTLLWRLLTASFTKRDVLTQSPIQKAD
jgi:NAD(P)-dependent dehydrogenase (short-subunit alcohol dehydrogenase family)